MNEVETARLLADLRDAEGASYPLQRRVVEWLEDWLEGHGRPEWKGVDTWRVLLLILHETFPDGAVRRALLHYLRQLWEGVLLPPHLLAAVVEALLGRADALPPYEGRGRDEPAVLPLAAALTRRLKGADAGERLPFVAGYVVAVDKANGSLTLWRADTFEPITVAVRPPWEYILRMIWPGARLHVFNLTADGGMDAAALCVVEPDYVVDITTIAAYCFGYGTEGLVIPEKYCLDRLGPADVSPPMVRGGLLGTYVAARVRDEHLSHEEAWQRALFGRMLDVVGVADEGALSRWEAEAPAHAAHLRKALDTLGRPADIDAEVSYVIPALGVRGRLDILHKKTDRWTVLELKARERVPRTPMTAHRMQAAFYQLMVTLAEEEAPEVAAFVLYTGDPEATLHPVPSEEADWLRQAVSIRNRIVGYEYWIAFQGVSVFGIIQQKRAALAGPQAPPWLARQYQEVIERIRTLSEDERHYIQELHGFLAREQWYAMVGSVRGVREERQCYAGLWRPQHLPSFDWARGLERVDEPHSPAGEVTFQYPSQAFFAARVGDTVVAVPEEKPWHRHLTAHRLLVGTVVEHVAHRIRVQFRDAAFWQRPFPKKQRWALTLETYISGYWRLLTAMGAFLSAPSEQRRLLMGKVLPLPQPPQAPVRDPELALTDHQRRLLAGVVAAREVYLVQGPPGTGKTRFLLRAVLFHHLAHQRRILLVGFTNRAVDEICGVLSEMKNVPFLRLGRTDHAAYFPHTLDGWQRRLPADVRAWKTRLAELRCVVTTVHTFTRMPYFHRIFPYDVVLADEASQMLEPYALGVLSRRRTPFVMIGDEKQLPAVTLQGEEEAAVRSRHLRQLGFISWAESFFGRLIRQLEALGREDLHGMLEEQGRMHQDIQRLAGTLFYAGKLRPVPPPDGEWQARPLQAVPDAVNPLTRRRVVFLNVETTGNGKENPAEVEAVLRAVGWCEGVGVAPEEMGVIAPFRAQVAAIHRALQRHYGTAAEKILVDTVERFQGGQRKAVIISFTVGTPALLELIGAPMPNRPEVDRKLNVMMTRAREYLVLIGNASVLAQGGAFRALLALLREGAGAEFLTLHP